MTTDPASNHCWRAPGTKPEDLAPGECCFVEGSYDTIWARDGDSPPKKRKIVKQKTEADIVREERLRLVPMLCSFCRDGKDELIKDVRGNYSHRRKPEAWLNECGARVIHNLLGTVVTVHLKDED